MVMMEAVIPPFAPIWKLSVLNTALNTFVNGVPELAESETVSASIEISPPPALSVTALLKLFVVNVSLPAPPL